MYEVFITKHFKKGLKPLIKQDKNLKSVLREALFFFDKRRSVSIGDNIYKLRLQRKPKGQSSGYRMYIYLQEFDGYLAPLCIFAKSQKETITLGELAYHMDSVQQELIDRLNQ